MTKFFKPGESGGSEQSRVDEAHRICEIIDSYEELLTPKELKFFGEMRLCRTCTPTQLFWLRDIKTKYAE